MLLLSIATPNLQKTLRAIGTFYAGDAPTSERLAKLIARLQSGPIPMSEFESQALNDGAASTEYALFIFLLRSLIRFGLLDVEVVCGQTRLARLSGALPDRPEILRLPKLRLSRFASIRPQHGGLLVESPFCPAQLVLLDEQSCLLCIKLAQGTTLAELISHSSISIDEPALAELVMSLGAVGVLEEPKATDHDALMQWEHHDAMFHARTRAGRCLGPQGGSYRFFGKRPPEPAIPSRTFSDFQNLPKAPLPARALALQDIMQQRRSLRSYGSRPIRAEDLGALLRLVAQNQSERLAKSQLASAYETLFRSYPGAGGCYELHIYPVVNRCEGVERGIYYYDGSKDRLCTVAQMNQAGDRLLQDAAYSMGSGSAPDILLCISARFGRVNWKYEGIAYALILKDVGVLLQTLYLVATALKLAPCALGCGNTEDFLLATGNRSFEEESVGEFAVGSQPDSSEASI